MDCGDLKLAPTCRRLFLRNWRYPVLDGGTRGVSVNVTIFVRYEDSDSRGDDFAKVIDYNVMRDALLKAGSPRTPGFIDRVLAELMTAPIVLANVEVWDKHAGTGTTECRVRQIGAC
ncbi:hypothetical protein BZM27_28525 [Paraburkholderia steynii]|uniref:Dihydroneopterin aldolase/epimerase domain-containing protein n=1 Tax=Paraburkholderia steynii TaxID=1245441 RepID=A0A4R0XBT9_9BURK|nr:hypothetical protein BZM27_28525 [Paraburkholderia steynii]